MGQKLSVYESVKNIHLTFIPSIIYVAANLSPE